MALALVGFIHLSLLWMLASILTPHSLSRISQEIQITVLSPSLAPPRFSAPPLSWMFQAPEEAVVPEPDIAITPGRDDSDTVTAGTMGQILPARPDPNHVNELPDVPWDLRPVAARAILTLRIFVLPDGSVAEARIIRSSGNGDLDIVAANYVVSNWRYIPAYLDGRPVQEWTTVFVRFGSAS